MISKEDLAFLCEEKYHIQCETKKEAKKILNCLDKLNLSWNSGTSYLNQTNWDSYREKNNIEEYLNLIMEKNNDIER